MLAVQRDAGREIEQKPDKNRDKAQFLWKRRNRRLVSTPPTPPGRRVRRLSYDDRTRVTASVGRSHRRVFSSLNEFGDSRANAENAAIIYICRVYIYIYIYGVCCCVTVLDSWVTYWVAFASTRTRARHTSWATFKHRTIFHYSA